MYNSPLQGKSPAMIYNYIWHLLMKSRESISKQQQTSKKKPLQKEIKESLIGLQKMEKEKNRFPIANYVEICEFELKIKRILETHAMDEDSMNGMEEEMLSDTMKSKIGALIKILIEEKDEITKLKDKIQYLSYDLRKPEQEFDHNNSNEIIGNYKNQEKEQGKAKKERLQAFKKQQFKSDKIKRLNCEKSKPYQAKQKPRKNDHVFEHESSEVQNNQASKSPTFSEQRNRNPHHKDSKHAQNVIKDRSAQQFEQQKFQQRPRVDSSDFIEDKNKNHHLNINISRGQKNLIYQQKNQDIFKDTTSVKNFFKDHSSIRIRTQNDLQEPLHQHHQMQQRDCLSQKLTRPLRSKSENLFVDKIPILHLLNQIHSKIDKMHSNDKGEKLQSHLNQRILSLGEVAIIDKEQSNKDFKKSQKEGQKKSLGKSLKKQNEKQKKNIIKQTHVNFQIQKLKPKQRSGNIEFRESKYTHKIDSIAKQIDQDLRKSLFIQNVYSQAKKHMQKASSDLKFIHK